MSGKRKRGRSEVEGVVSLDAIVSSRLHILSSGSTCGALFFSGSGVGVEESGAQLLGCGEVVLESRTFKLPETVLCVVDVEILTPCSTDRDIPCDGNSVL